MYEFGSHDLWGGTSVYKMWPAKNKLNSVQTAIIALLAAFLLVMGVWPISDETDSNRHPGVYKGFLWVSVVIGSVIIGTLVLSLILNSTVWKNC
jgi:predicted transporter